MAKVFGPLHSDDARGAIAKSLVFMGWKGTKTVRQYVTPANRMSDGQAEARTYLGSVGLTNKQIEIASDLQIAVALKAPSNQSWASYFAKVSLGPLNANIKAALTAYAGASSTIKGYYDDAAADIPLTGFQMGYGETAKLTGGEQLFVAFNAGYIMGLTLCPVAPVSASEAQVNAFAAAFAA